MQKSRRSLTGVPNDGIDFRVMGWEESGLRIECDFHATREIEPLGSRTWAEVAKGADDLLSRSFVGDHGLDEEVVDVGSILVGRRVLAQVRGHYATDYGP